MDFIIKVSPRAQRQPAVFVVDIGGSQHKSVFQMAFLAAGTQQGHREDVPSCAVTPTDLYSTVYTADPLSFSFYLQLISSLLNLSTCEGCAAPSHKPLKLIVPAQIFTADLTRLFLSVSAATTSTSLLCWHSHIWHSLGMKHPRCSFPSQKRSS